MKLKDYYTPDIVSSYADIDRNLEDRELKSIKIISTLDLIEGSKFIDVGCGDGKFLTSLSLKVKKKLIFFGGDYSLHRVEQAKENTGFQISQINLEERLGFESKSFDCVYSGEVVEHLYNPDNMILEINRILKNNGHLILTTPNLNSWISRMLFLFGIQPLNYECSTVSSIYGYGFLKKFKKQDWPIGHVRLFNMKSLIDILENNGFAVKKIQGVVFEFMPQPLRLPDRLFSYFPSLASGLVVHAVKCENKQLDGSSAGVVRNK